MYQRSYFWKPFNSELAKVLFQFVMKIAPLIFDFYFVKVPILSFLVTHFVALCWNKIFSVSPLSVSRLYFFFMEFLSRTCYCTVSTYFQISFNNFLPNKQTNKEMKTGGKNNSCSTKEWKLFGLSCDAKDCKHYILAFKIYKSLVKESKTGIQSWVYKTSSG